MRFSYLLAEYWRYCKKTGKWWVLLFVFFLALFIPLIAYFQSTFSLTHIYVLF